MIDLNTQKKNTLSPQGRAEHPLYQSGQLEQKSMTAMRASFNHWIRSLPMEERFLALKIHSSPLPQTIRKFFFKIDESNHERTTQMQSCSCESSKEEAGVELRRGSRKLQKSFYDSLVFVTDGHDYLDHICFEYGLLECPQKLFDFLAASLDAPCSRPMVEALKGELSAHRISERIMKVKSKEQAMVEILNYLRQQVLLRFREVMLDSQFITRNLQQQKRRKKQFNLFWKHLSQELRYNLLLLNCPNITQLYKELIINDIFISQDELKGEIEDLLKLQKNQFCNRIFKCKFKKSDSALIDYYCLVYELWKKELEKSKKRKQKHLTEKEGKSILGKEKEFGKKSKNLQHRKSNSLESNETNVTDNQKKDKSRLKIEVHEHYNNEQIEEVQCEKEVSRKPKEEKSRAKHKNKNRQHEPREKQKQEKTSKEEIFEPQLINPQKNKTQVCLQKRKSQIQPQQLRQAHFSRLSQQLEEMSDKTSEEANKYHDRRVIAFERIQYLLAFYNISIRLFGSCASGIAIKNSDIDIAVNNSILLLYDYLPQNLKLLGALESLQQVFTSQPCFTYIKLIKTATIPVIKLTIDTSVQFMNPYYGQVYYSLNRSHFSGPVQADITIQTVNKLSQCSHLGLISTQAINEWLGQIASLHTIVIFMKQILKNHRLNITYEGGLNTFAMIVLLVAYIRQHKLEKEDNPAKVLYQILNFYVHQFNEKKWGIDLLRSKQKSIYYRKESKNQGSKDTADLQILDPKCEGKNMTRNCYQFCEIKNLFKQVLLRCFQLPRRQLQRWSEQLCEREMILERIRSMDESCNVFTQLLNTT